MSCRLFVRWWIIWLSGLWIGAARSGWKLERVVFCFHTEFDGGNARVRQAQGRRSALYLAVEGDRGLERLLAIKTVLPHLADEEYLARFRNEATLAVKLSHGNLVPAFDAGQVGGEPFLAMEFIEGRDLRTVWNRCAKKLVAFPIDVAVYIVKELCRGLAYAHSSRDLELGHRCVAPPKIMVSFSGEVKLTDFGLASSTMTLEAGEAEPGIIYGIPAYLSPEQARGEELDGRSDLYAATIILWEMLTGQQLFPPSKDARRDLVERARNPRVPPPSSRALRVPAALDEICLKALAARKEDRYASSDELCEALTAFLASEYPQTDASRLESFLGELFAEDIARERKEREELLENTRNGVQTMPPTDELRRTLDQSSNLDAGVRRASDSGQLLEAPVIDRSRRHIDVGPPSSVSREAVLLHPPRETSQATSWAVDDHVSGHILAAAGAMTGLDKAMPIGIETRDVPRWSYLVAVIPDLGTRLRQLRLDRTSRSPRPQSGSFPAGTTTISIWTICSCLKRPWTGTEMRWRTLPRRHQSPWKPKTAYVGARRRK